MLNAIPHSRTDCEKVLHHSCFPLGVFLCRYITTVTPSRVYKLLPLLRCLSVGGSESCVYAGFSPDVDSTVEQMTDLASSWGDKSTVQHSAAFPLPPLFSLLALFTYVCLCLAFSFPYSRYINVLTLLLLLVSAWHSFMACLHSHSLSLSLSRLLHLNSNHGFLTRRNTTL